MKVFKEHDVAKIENHARKGSQILVKGELATEKWTDSEGREHSQTVIKVTGARGQTVVFGAGAQGQGSAAPARQPQETPQQRAAAEYAQIDLDDNIPF